MRLRVALLNPRQPYLTLTFLLPELFLTKKFWTTWVPTRNTHRRKYRRTTNDLHAPVKYIVHPATIKFQHFVHCARLFSRPGSAMMSPKESVRSQTKSRSMPQTSCWPTRDSRRSAVSLTTSKRFGGSWSLRSPRCRRDLWLPRVFDSRPRCPNNTAR